MHTGGTWGDGGMGTYRHPHFEFLLFLVLKNNEEGFRRLLTPSNPFRSAKKFRFPRVPLWFFIALKMGVPLTDKYRGVQVWKTDVEFHWDVTWVNSMKTDF